MEHAKRPHKDRQTTCDDTTKRNVHMRLPGSVTATASSLPRTSETTRTALWLGSGERAPAKRSHGESNWLQHRAASMRTALCSLARKWSAQCRTNWVSGWPAKGSWVERSLTMWLLRPSISRHDLSTLLSLSDSHSPTELQLHEGFLKFCIIPKPIITRWIER